MKKIGVAILGCGTVGSSVAKHLVADREALAARSGVDIEITGVVDVDPSRLESMPIPPDRQLRSADSLWEDPRTHVVVELVGGTGIARTLIEQALDAGKHVVTANKALLAHHGTELLTRARSQGVTIAFEASCGGGIPLMRTLYDGLMANEIRSIYGIVNGTCNYILTQMTEHHVSYAEALSGAQASGLAEADPTLDVDGSDSAHKIAIMASMAFGVRVPLEQIPVEGIDSLDAMDVGYGEQLGYVPKLLAIAERQNTQETTAPVWAGVRPCFVAGDHPLAWVSGPFNAVSIYGNRTGHTMYYGRGAGGSPTAAAIIADLVSIGNGSYARQVASARIWPDMGVTVEPADPGSRVSRFYLRMMVEDRPGQLAAIMAILGNHQISVASVLQHEPPEDAPWPQVVPVVVVTHQASQHEISSATAEIAALEHVHGSPSVIAILDEPEVEF